MTIDELNAQLTKQDDLIIELTESESTSAESLARLRFTIASLTTKLEQLSSVEKPKAERKAKELHEMDLEKRGEIVELCAM